MFLYFHQHLHRRLGRQSEPFHKLCEPFTPAAFTGIASSVRIWNRVDAGLQDLTTLSLLVSEEAKHEGKQAEYDSPKDRSREYRAAPLQAEEVDWEIYESKRRVRSAHRF